MPQFQFRLANVLRLREATRDERRGQLAEALRLLTAAEARLAELCAEAARIKGLAQSAARPGVVDVDRLLETQRYEIALRLEEQRAQQQVRVIADEAERRRLVLVEADRDVRVLERLRARQEERHEQHDRRREARLLDEAACRPF